MRRSRELRLCLSRPIPFCVAALRWRSPEGLVDLLGVVRSYFPQLEGHRSAATQKGIGRDRHNRSSLLRRTMSGSTTPPPRSATCTGTSWRPPSTAPGRSHSNNHTPKPNNLSQHILKRLKRKWWARRDLNPRPPGYEPGALPG